MLGQEFGSYQCTQCDKSYGRNDRFKHYIKIAHEGIKPFKCNICNASFTAEQRMKSHIDKHLLLPYSRTSDYRF